MADAAASELTLKLHIDTKSQRVLFAEADRKAVDFLFHIFDLPRRTVIKCLTKHGTAGCLGNIYDSMENFTQEDHHHHQEMLEKVGYRGGNSATCATKYTCFSDVPGAICPSCGTAMSFEMKCVTLPVTPARNKQQSDSGGGGDGDAGVTYMVMDDLVVEPMSTIPSIALLTKFDVTELGPLEEKVVDLSLNEASELVKASLTSKTVLSTVFLQKNMANLVAEIAKQPKIVEEEALRLLEDLMSKVTRVEEILRKVEGLLGS